MPNLNPQQFNEHPVDEHPAGGYQLSLPGMTRPELGESRHKNWNSKDEIHVSHIFAHEPDLDLRHSRHLSTQFKEVDTSSLIPTQERVHEDYLHEESRSTSEPEVSSASESHYFIEDGHHRVARALLNNEKKIWVRHRA